MILLKVNRYLTYLQESNITVYVACPRQSFFNKNQREVSLNSDYMIIFKNLRDITQFMHLEDNYYQLICHF